MHLLVDANTGTNKSEVSPALGAPDQHTRTPGRRVWGWQTWSHDLSHRLTFSSHIHFSPITFSPICSHAHFLGLARFRVTFSRALHLSQVLCMDDLEYLCISWRYQTHATSFLQPLTPISNTLKSVFGTHRAPKRAPFDTKHPFWRSQGLIERGEHYTMLIDLQGMIMVVSTKDHHMVVLLIIIFWWPLQKMTTRQERPPWCRTSVCSPGPQRALQTNIFSYQCNTTTQCVFEDQCVVKSVAACKWLLPPSQSNVRGPSTDCV